jgi:hypothetical protein
MKEADVFQFAKKWRYSLVSQASPSCIVTVKRCVEAVSGYQLERERIG